MSIKKQLEELENEYKNIPIPDQLGSIVQNALEAERKIILIDEKREKRSFKMKKTIKGLSASAAAVALFTVGLNVSPVFAQSLLEVPVVGSIVNVLTFKQYEVNDKDFNAHIDVPQVEGLENKELQQELNKELANQGEASYQQFIEKIETLKGENGEQGKLALDSGYEVLTNTDTIFALEVSEVETMASSNTVNKFYVLDKKAGKIIELEDLFKDDTYVKAISDNIIKQMEEQMKADQEKVYWVHEEDTENFTSIKKDQNFYINKEGKLVICFDKYEVTPGYMGTPEFVIPTEVMQNMLVNNDLVK